MNTASVNDSRSGFSGASGLNLLAGLWLIISPFVLAFHQVQDAHWNNIASGIAIALVAIIRLSVPRHAGWTWANLLLGVWVLLSPWALGFARNGTEDLGFGSELVWNNVITGGLVAFLAVVSLAGGRAVPPETVD
jgi:hypothetical protein